MIDQIALGALSSFCYDLLKKGVSNLGDLIKNSSYAKDLNLSDSDVEIIVNKIQENNITNTNQILNIISSLKQKSGDTKIVNQINSSGDNNIDMIKF